MKFLVTKERAGSAITQTIHNGLVRWKAVESYARATAAAEPGEVVTLYRGREVLRRSNEVVTARCHICSEPIDGDLAPAQDAFTGLPTCENCVRAQRHARATA